MIASKQINVLQNKLLNLYSIHFNRHIGVNINNILNYVIYLNNKLDKINNELNIKKPVLYRQYAGVYKYYFNANQSFQQIFVSNY